MAEPDVKAVLTAITDLQNKDALDASLTMGPFALAIQKWEELSRRFSWAKGSFTARIMGGSPDDPAGSNRPSHHPTLSQMQEIFFAMGAAPTGAETTSTNLFPGKRRRTEYLRDTHANLVVEAVARDLGYVPEWEDPTAPSVETLLLTPREWMQTKYTTAESFFPPRYSVELPVKVPIYEDLYKLYNSVTGVPPSESELDSLRALFWGQFKDDFSASSLKDLRTGFLRLTDKVVRDDEFAARIVLLARLPAKYFESSNENFLTMDLADVVGVVEGQQIEEKRKAEDELAALAMPNITDEWHKVYKELNGTDTVSDQANNAINNIINNISLGNRIDRGNVSPDVYKVAIAFGVEPEKWSDARLTAEIELQVGKAFSKGTIPPRLIMELSNNDTMTGLLKSLQATAFGDPNQWVKSASEVVRNNINAVVKQIGGMANSGIREDITKAFDDNIAFLEGNDPLNLEKDTIDALKRRKPQIINEVLVDQQTHEAHQDKLLERARDQQIADSEVIHDRDRIPFDFQREKFEFGSSLASHISRELTPLREHFIYQAANVQAEKDKVRASNLSLARNEAASLMHRLGGDLGVQNLQELVNQQMATAGSDPMDSNINVMKLLDEFITPEAAIESIAAGLKESDYGFDAIEAVFAKQDKDAADKRQALKTPGQAALDRNSEDRIKAAEEEIAELEQERTDREISDPSDVGNLLTIAEIDARQLELRNVIRNAGIAEFPDRPEGFSINQRLFDEDGRDVTDQLKFQADALREQQFTQIDFEELLSGVPEEEQAATREFLLNNFSELRNEFDAGFQAGDGLLLQDLRNIPELIGGEIPDEDDDSPGAFSRRTLGLQAQGEARARAKQRARISSTTNFQQFATANLQSIMKKINARTAKEITEFTGSKARSRGGAVRQVRF